MDASEAKEDMLPYKQIWARMSGSSGGKAVKTLIEMERNEPLSWVQIPLCRSLTVRFGEIIYLSMDNILTWRWQWIQTYSADTTQMLLYGQMLALGRYLAMCSGFSKLILCQGLCPVVSCHGNSRLWLC